MTWLRRTGDLTPWLSSEQSTPAALVTWHPGSAQLKPAAPGGLTGKRGSNPRLAAGGPGACLRRRCDAWCATQMAACCANRPPGSHPAAQLAPPCFAQFFLESLGTIIVTCLQRTSEAGEVVAATRLEKRAERATREAIGRDISRLEGAGGKKKREISEGGGVQIGSLSAPALGRGVHRGR